MGWSFIGFLSKNAEFVNELIKNKGNTIKAGSTGNPVGESSKSIAYIKNILHNILNVK
jgi:hypothetical protein